jgi:hypothetical protein
VGPSEKTWGLKPKIGLYLLCVVARVGIYIAAPTVTTPMAVLKVILGLFPFNLMAQAGDKV